MVASRPLRRCGAARNSQEHSTCVHTRLRYYRFSRRRESTESCCRVFRNAQVQPFPRPILNESGEMEERETKMTVEEDSENFTQIIHDLSAAPYQQTVSRSFTLAGLGLHTGEEVVVRVRPAFAGDGRYFVRVPEGTNKHLAMGGDRMDEEARSLAKERVTLPTSQMAEDPLLEQKQTAAFMQYSQAQDEQGYPGTFEEFILDSGLDVEVAGLQPVEFDDTQEPVEPKPTDGSALDASVRNYAGRTPFCQLLGSQHPDHPDLQGGIRTCIQVAAAELLLAVMEGLHVDNARIEFEGACEMPILDGSGQFWVENFAAVGLTPAYKEGDETLVRKQSWRPNTPICVFDHDSFITLYPAGLYRRITAGVEPLDCPVIGSQWFSLEACAGSDPVRSFAIDVAPARTWLPSVDLAYAARDAGYLKAGTTDCVMVADGDSWRDNVEMRFIGDEPARHALMDVMGDLALLGDKGNSGLPCGHIVAFNAGHDLVMDFIVHCAEAIEAGDIQEFPFMLLPSEMDYVRQVQMEMMDDMLEKGDYQGQIDPATGEHTSRRYRREPFVGESGQFAEDQPEVSEQAKKHVRREIDILREGVSAKFEAIHKEALEIEKDAAEELAAIERGETPKSQQPQYVMYKTLGDKDESDDVDDDTMGVHEDEYEQGGILMPTDAAAQGSGAASPVDTDVQEGPQADGGATTEDSPPSGDGKSTEGGSDSGL